jgi:hypothetical protein
MKRIGVLLCGVLWGCSGIEQSQSSEQIPLSDGDGGGSPDVSPPGDDDRAGGGGEADRRPFCTPRTPTPISSLDRGVRALAVDATHVFWVAPSSALAGVYRVPKAGGATTLLDPVRSFQDDGADWDLALDGDVLFVVESGDTGVSPGPGEVRVVTSPEHSTVLAIGDRYPCRGGGHPSRVTIDASRVYWTEDAGRFLSNYDDSTAPTCDPTVSFRYLRSVSKTGGDARRLARVSSMNAVVDREFVYFTEGTTLYRLPKTASEGELPTPVATGLTLTRPLLALDGNRIYIGERDGSVYAVDRRRGTVRSVASGGGQVEQFAFDERYVYWVSSGEGGVIRRVLKSGGPSEVVIPEGAQSVAVDGRYIYWGGYGTVMRRCK